MDLGKTFRYVCDPITKKLKIEWCDPIVVKVHNHHSRGDVAKKIAPQRPPRPTSTTSDSRAPVIVTKKRKEKFSTRGDDQSLTSNTSEDSLLTMATGASKFSPDWINYEMSNGLVAEEEDRSSMVSMLTGTQSSGLFPGSFPNFSQRDNSESIENARGANGFEESKGSDVEYQLAMHCNEQLDWGGDICSTAMTMLIDRDGITACESIISEPTTASCSTHSTAVASEVMVLSSQSLPSSSISLVSPSDFPPTNNGILPKRVSTSSVGNISSMKSQFLPSAIVASFSSDGVNDVFKAVPHTKQEGQEGQEGDVHNEPRGCTLESPRQDRKGKEGRNEIEMTGRMSKHAAVVTPSSLSCFPAFIIDEGHRDLHAPASSLTPQSSSSSSTPHSMWGKYANPFIHHLRSFLIAGGQFSVGSGLVGSGSDSHLTKEGKMAAFAFICILFSSLLSVFYPSHFIAQAQIFGIGNGSFLDSAPILKWGSIFKGNAREDRWAYHDMYRGNYRRDQTAAVVERLLGWRLSHVEMIVSDSLTLSQTLQQHQRQEGLAKPAKQDGDGDSNDRKNESERGGKANTLMRGKYFISYHRSNYYF